MVGSSSEQMATLQIFNSSTQKILIFPCFPQKKPCLQLPAFKPDPWKAATALAGQESLELLKLPGNSTNKWEPPGQHCLPQELWRQQEKLPSPSSSALTRTTGDPGICSCHGIPEWFRLEGTTGAHPVPPPCSSRVLWSSCVQMGLEYVQGRRPHSLSGLLFQYSVTSQ